jgi:hypothetical protein
VWGPSNYSDSSTLPHSLRMYRSRSTAHCWKLDSHYCGIDPLRSSNFGGAALLTFKDKSLRWPMQISGTNCSQYSGTWKSFSSCFDVHYGTCGPRNVLSSIGVFPSRLREAWTKNVNCCLNSIELKAQPNLGRPAFRVEDGVRGHCSINNILT